MGISDLIMSRPELQTALKLRVPAPVNGTSSLLITQPRGSGSARSLTSPVQVSEPCSSAFTVQLEGGRLSSAPHHHRAQARGRQALSVKGQMGNTVGFVGHIAPVTSSQLDSCKKNQTKQP